MRTLIFMLCLGIFAACDKTEEPKDITCPDCTGDLLCTEEFRTLTFTVTDNAGDAVILDDFEATIVATGEVLDHGDWLGQLIPGAYIIAQDSDFDKVACDGTEIRFEGFLEGNMVVNELFVVGKDCCHIFLQEGPETVLIP